MSNYGFNGFSTFNNGNPLAELLKNYVPQQQSQATTPTTSEPQRGCGNSALYEIDCQADIDYIEIDKSGRMQIFICQSEKRIYTRRYNHSKQKPDYKEYIEEEVTKLTQNNDANAGLSQIAEAMVAVANKLESLHSEIQELKKVEPPKEDSARRPNGQFKKKGE